MNRAKSDKLVLLPHARVAVCPNGTNALLHQPGISKSKDLSSQYF